MKYLFASIVMFATFAASAAGGQTSVWLTSKVYGHDNNMASLRPAIITSEVGEYTIKISNQFGFSCGLVFDKKGDPAELSDCASTLNESDKWTASPHTIKLRCVSTKTERICKGQYTLTSGSGYSSDAEFAIARKR